MGRPEGTATLVSESVLGCLPLHEAPRHTERAEGRPEQHNCGAAIWDRNCRMRHRAALRAGVLAKRKHCGTKDHSDQRELPYGNDIVFHALLLHAYIAYVKNTFYADAFLAHIAFSLRDRAMKNEV